MKTENTDNHEKNIQKYYDNYWVFQSKKHIINENIAFHHGFFDKDTKNIYQAVQNMNKLIGDLLNLKNIKSGKILDAGCGIGSSSIYLAKNYPKYHFTGITLSPVELKLANEIKEKQKIANVNFLKNNYLKTEFINEFFDGAFALESISSTYEKRLFVQEMYRILKPGGKLVVIDWFRTQAPIGSFMQKVYDAWRYGAADFRLDKSSDFISYLNEEGFSEINIKNLNKNIRRSLYATFLNFLPVFCIEQFKKLIGVKKQKPSDGLKYLLSLSVLDIFVGLSKIANFQVITAIKK